MRRFSWRVAPVGLGAGMVAGVVDGGLALQRVPASLEFLLVAAGLLGLLGLPIAIAIEATVWTVHRTWRPVWSDSPKPAVWIAMLAVAAVLLGVGLFAISTWVFERNTPPPAARRFVVPLLGLGFVLTLLVARGLPKVRAFRRAPLALAIVALAAVTATVPFLLKITQTQDLRWGFVGLAYLVSFGLLRHYLRRDARAGIRGLILSLGLVFAALGGHAFVTKLDMRIVAARYAPTTGTAAGLLARATDIDQDGYSPLGGEGDCDPWDGAVHPFALDTPGNGIDEDCHQGDLDPATIAPRVQVSPAIPPDADRPDLILITVDTLRADHLGIYGYERDVSPQIDRWFADAVVFERAYSSSPVTDRALPTLLGGLYPSMYTEALEWDAHVLSSRRTLLFERLREAGYHTAAFVTADAVGDHGLDQGIEHLVNVPRKPGARRVTQLASRYLRSFVKEEPRRPLALWLHYFDPHGPYEAPPLYRHWDDGGKSTAANRVDRYDGEVRYVDTQLGRFRQTWERLVGARPTVVIFGSDHGEEFLDHGGWYHAEELYDESVRVPLMILAPGVRARRIAEPVGLVDFMPTILELVGIPAPTAIEGTSLARALREDQPIASHPIVLEQFKHRTSTVEKIAVIDKRHKLIFDLVHKVWELYDVFEDPGEQQNLYGHDPAVTGHMRHLLRSYWAKIRAARWQNPTDGAF